MNQVNKTKQLTTTSFDVKAINSEINERTLLLTPNTIQPEASTSNAVVSTDCVDDINIEKVNINVDLKFDCTNCLKCTIL